MFLLRCVFCLTIVYAAILLGDGSWGRHQSGGLVPAIAAVKDSATSGLTSLCWPRPTRCVTDNGALTTLVAATVDLEGLAGIGAPVGRNAAPTPPAPGPRDHRRAFRLTPPR